MDVTTTIITYMNINTQEDIIRESFDPKDFEKIKSVWEKSSNITTTTLQGTIYHFRNGILHNNKGPAKYNNEIEIWYKNGYKHRTDGPALVEYEVDHKTLRREEWWVNGKQQRPKDQPCIVEYKNGRIIIEKWKRNSQNHRSKDLPSVIKYFENGNVAERRWYLNNDLHRKNGPAYVKYHEDGSLRYECWYSHGLVHRNGEPAEILYSKSGDIEGYSWAFYGIINRPDGPAILMDGLFYWYFEGEIHRVNGPAVESENINIWYFNGKIHRDDGPAVVGKGKFEGYTAWYRNNLKHRDGNPAVIFADNCKLWYQNGVLKRTDGPVIEFATTLYFNSSEHSGFDTIIRDQNGTYRCYSGFDMPVFYTKDELYEYFNINIPDASDSEIANHDKIESEIDIEISRIESFVKIFYIID